MKCFVVTVIIRATLIINKQLKICTDNIKKELIDFVKNINLTRNITFYKRVLRSGT